MRFLGKFRVHLGRVEKAIGALLVLAGIFFLTGGVQTASYWLLEPSRCWAGWGSKRDGRSCTANLSRIGAAWRRC